MRLRSMSTIIVGLFASWLLAATAGAQLTTGTVTGTVKDAQGGVIPGATVMLTSETRARSLQPAFTNATGDFVFANVPPDTYTSRSRCRGSRRSSAGRLPSAPVTASRVGHPDARGRRR